MNRPILNIVSTPIGNLEDITIRALKVLASSDYIICEDSRVSRKLLAKHNIDKPLIIYNDNSGTKQRINILNKLNEGASLALISDAGTPLISDPGFKLINFCKSQNIEINPIPGPSAPICALTISGFATDKFYFGGFLPRTTNHIKATLLSLQNLPASLIFFETANRLNKTLSAIKDTFPHHQMAVARELTKLFQECISGTAQFLLDYYTQNPPKGEIVIIISGNEPNEISIESFDQEILKQLSRAVSAKDIANELSSRTTFSKKLLYDRINTIKNNL